MKTSFHVHRVERALECEADREEIVSALAGRGYRIFEAVQPAGAIVPYHAHEDEETIIVVEGRVQFNVEEELVLLEKGDMIVISPGAIHMAAPVDDRPARLLITFENEKEDPISEPDGEGEEEDDPAY